MAHFRHAAALARHAVRAASPRVAVAGMTVQRAPARGMVGSSEDDVLGSVRDILASKGGDYYSIRDDAMVIEAVNEMVKHKIGSLIIMDKDQCPVSILTESDYMKKMPNRSPDTTRVSEIMSTKEFTYVSPDSSLMHTMEAMANQNIRHVPVIHHNKVLGMVSVGDCVKELVARHRKDAQHMRDFISGGY